MKVQRMTEAEFVKQYSEAPISVEEVAGIAANGVKVGTGLQQAGAEFVEATERFEEYLNTINFKFG